MRIANKTVIEQMDAAKRIQETDQGLVLWEKQQARIATLLAVIEQCELALLRCANYDCCDKDEYRDQALAAIKKVKDNP